VYVRNPQVHLLPVDYRPIRIDVGEEVKHGSLPRLTSEQLLMAGQSHLSAPCSIKPSPSPVARSYCKTKRTRLLIKAFVTTQLLRKVEQLHWLPWQTPMCAGCSA